MMTFSLPLSVFLICALFLAAGATVQDDELSQLTGTSGNETDVGQEIAMTEDDLDGERESRNVPSCTEEFRKVPGHTMCLPDSPSLAGSGVSAADRKKIVKLHNDYRSKVKPPASNMQRMVWDDKLAEVAQKWAKVCQNKHDSVRDIPGIRVQTGQNMYFSGFKSKWDKAVEYWYNEVRYFKYGEDPESYLKKYPNKYNIIGHYTQLVKATTARVGCGFAVCPNLQWKYRYICNYSPQQVFQDYKRPYEKGTRCGLCKGSCKNGLCECKGFVCQNNGALDAKTCKCSCQGLTSGFDCRKVKCSSGDMPGWCKRGASECKYVNIPPHCPHLCGLC